MKDPLEIQVGGSHYKDMKIQPIEFIQANGLDFCQGSVIKYVSRYRNKNGLEDLQKARNYLDLMIRELDPGHAVTGVPIAPNGGIIADSLGDKGSIEWRAKKDTDNLCDECIKDYRICGANREHGTDNSTVIKCDGFAIM